MRYLIYFISQLFFIYNSFSQVVSYYEIENQKLKVYCDFVDFEIQAYTPEIIKITSYLDKQQYDDSSYVVIRHPEICNIQISSDENFIYYKTDSLIIRVAIDTFGVEFISHNKVLVEQLKNSFFRAFKAQGCLFGLKENEAIYGLGSKAVDINRRYLSTILYNQNKFGYEYGEHWLNTNIPFFVSSEYYGIFVDNHTLQYYTADINRKNTIQYNANSHQFKYFFISGSDYTDILSKYQYLTGKQPLLPRWACGFFLSKISFGDDENCRETADWMHKNGYPVDAMVFDYSWFGYAKNMGNFTWDESKFKNPDLLIYNLKQKGIKSILITEPFISESSVNFEEAVEKDLFVKDTLEQYPKVSILGSDVILLDIFKEKARNWVWKKYSGLLNKGIEGFWIDLIEPEFHGWKWVHATGSGEDNHNNYSLVWAQNLYENYINEYPNKRPYFMYRAGWGGIQRYAGTFLCGDEKRSWSGLKSQIPVMLGLQMSGAPMFSTDIGGFAGSQEIDKELLIRWFQFGTFNPIMRQHMGGTGKVEPWNFNRDIQNIIRDYIKLRYKLLPYNYTLFWENSEFSIPPARPMNYYYNEMKFSNINDQFFWGYNFLVAPVTEKHTKERKVLLPKGRWIDYNTKKHYNGDTLITIEAPLETMPLFIRSGSFIPTINQILNTNEYTGDTIIVEYYPDFDGNLTTYTMYEDDGITSEANLKGLYQLIKFTGTAGPDSIKITQKAEGSYPGQPESRNMFYKIYSPGYDFVAVTKDSIDLYQALSKVEYNKISEGYYNDIVNDILEIKYKFSGDSTEIVITKVIENDNSKENDPKVYIYPNPSNGKIYIILTDIIPGKYFYSIYDLNGKKIKNNEEIDVDIMPFIFSIDFTKFPVSIPNGVYYINIEGKNYQNSEKFIIE
jgi:oligosaccharide 4-alpha-D-glucosyltransferase